MSGLDLRGPADGLLDAAFAGLGVRGLGGDTEGVVWRARLRDDLGRVWRTSAPAPAGLAAGWAAAKPAAAPPVAALGSLRPVTLDVRAESPDGRAAARSFVRRLHADGVQVRRWRAPGPVGTLHRPPVAPAATLLVDATSDPPAHVPLAAALLCSRGVLVLVAAQAPDLAAERLAAVPGAGPPVRLAAGELPLPPGVPAREPGEEAAWDALLERLSAVPRGAA